jgi:hypothetical protein
MSWLRIFCLISIFAAWFFTADYLVVMSLNSAGRWLCQNDDWCLYFNGNRGTGLLGVVMNIAGITTVINCMLRGRR